MPTVLLCPGITPVSFGALGVAMETQETRTQGVSGTNGMLHEAKVDRRVPKTVHLNKVGPFFRKNNESGEGLIPDIAGEKTGKWNCKEIFQFQLTPSGKETEREKKKKSPEIPTRYFLLSSLPSAVFSSVKFEECRHFYYALE
ncbi:hypothetical protein CEXT_337461 [Caerostris extrusa]|uniref:Uncharacterized protein n=1 Tax=Caerostris extrusa TaxID=172846 RepID=A0AAV4N2Q4_CAEEX|nr:hypothetical protein CEXT_337461 [Caerostris extrusa]